MSVVRDGTFSGASGHRVERSPVRAAKFLKSKVKVLYIYIVGFIHDMCIYSGLCTGYVQGHRLLRMYYI